MNKYNPTIHHRRSIRLKGYDYSQAGAYFITICCEDRACLFGDVVNGEMELNDAGRIAFNEWLKTAEIRKNISLGVFVIMPNHIHGIIIINDIGRGELHSPNNDHGELHSPNNEQSELHSPNNKHGVMHSPNNEHGELETPQPLEKMGECNSPNNNNIMGECNSPLRGPANNIGAIVRGYKSSVTKQIRIFNNDIVVWQRNYHEHIIRNEQSHETISNYIVNNPKKWAEDKFYNQ